MIINVGVGDVSVNWSTDYGTTVPSPYVFFILVQTSKQYPYNLYAARRGVKTRQNGLCCTQSLGLSPLRVG